MDKPNKIFIFTKNKTLIATTGIWLFIFVLQICFPSRAIFSAWMPINIVLYVLDYFGVSLSFMNWLLGGGCIYVFIAISIIYTFIYYFLLSVLVEKQKLFKYFLIGAVVCIVASGFYFYSDCISYNSWTLTESVQLREACPDGPNAYYKPNYADYKKEIIIPNTLAGSMIGLHLALTLAGIIALIKLIYIRIKKNKNSSSTHVVTFSA